MDEMIEETNGDVVTVPELKCPHDKTVLRKGVVPGGDLEAHHCDACGTYYTGERIAQLIG